jgi:hypothetical protein
MQGKFSAVTRRPAPEAMSKTVGTRRSAEDTSV